MIIELDYLLETSLDKKHGWKRNIWKSLVRCDNCNKERVVAKSSVINGIGDEFCQQCAASKYAKHHLSSNKEDYIKFQQESGFCLLDDNIPPNGITKIRWRCPMGHVTIKCLNGLKAGHPCHLCSKRRKRGLDDYLTLANQKGVQFIGPFPQNISTPTNWKCKCNKTIFTTFRRIERGCLCFDCGIKKITGPNHIMYNPLLTRDERERKRIYGSQLDSWRKAVYKRFNHICQKCHTKTKCHAHHIFNWCGYKNLRFIIENGICLCPSCHRRFHNIYGCEDNNLDQLEEFIDAKLHLYSLLNQ